MKDTIPGKLSLQLKRERKLLTMRQHELTDFQWLAVSGWLNNFPQLKLVCELKERNFNIWDCATPEEALAECLRWPCLCVERSLAQRQILSSPKSLVPLSMSFLGEGSCHISLTLEPQLDRR